MSYYVLNFHWFRTNLASKIVYCRLGQMSDFFYRHFTWLNCMLFHIIKDLSFIWNNQVTFDVTSYKIFYLCIFHFQLSHAKIEFLRMPQIVLYIFYRSISRFNHHYNSGIKIHDTYDFDQLFNRFCLSFFAIARSIVAIKKVQRTAEQTNCWFFTKPKFW